MKFYPEAVILKGEYQTQISVTIENGEVTELQNFYERGGGYVISPAFVNAHSHLEYRGLLNKILKLPYWEWIRKLVQLKYQQEPDQLILDTLLAAQENKIAGVGLIGEVSDRPYSGKALEETGLKGVIFQEVITFLEHKDPSQRLLQIEKNREINKKYFSGEIYLSPHAPHTVDPVTLKSFGNSKKPFSIHVAESHEENQFFEHGHGSFVEWYKSLNIPLKSPGIRVVDYLNQMGLARPKAQWVHCCDLNSDEVKLIAEKEVSVVHCPRSNYQLACPIAPIKQMIDAGMIIGLGMDSVASSGSIDMLEEIRWAQKLSGIRGEFITPTEVWKMATQWGAKSLGREEWDIYPGSNTPLIKIFAQDFSTFQSFVDTAYKVEWING